MGKVYSESPTNSDDVIDSRDIIKRMTELEEARSLLVLAISAAEESGSGSDKLEAAQALAEWDADDDGRELGVLKVLAEQGEGCPDWQHGETLIRHTYFETYAEELAADIGAINPNASWPNSFIDWERAADALKADYTTIDFDGVDYLVRS